MRIAYVTPGFGPCGGMRVIAEHVNRLVARDHDVFVLSPEARQPRWIQLGVPVAPLAQVRFAKPFDVVVATGYATVEWALLVPAIRRHWFVQMAEWCFFPDGTAQWHAALSAYALGRDAGFNVVTIAKWVQEEMQQRWGIHSTIVRNGVNREDFYPGGRKKRVVIIEGDDRNAAKDVDGIAWQVARELRKEFGVKLWGYAGWRHPHADIFDHFVPGPTTRQMRQLYQPALFLLKASRYDALACAPVEAMACGTPTCRALIRGDDDLLDGENCLRTGYDYDSLLEAARTLLLDDVLRRKLTAGAREYAAEHLDWEPKIDRLEGIYSGT